MHRIRSIVAAGSYCVKLDVNRSLDIGYVDLLELEMRSSLSLGIFGMVNCQYRVRGYHKRGGGPFSLAAELWVSFGVFNYVFPSGCKRS